MDATELSSDSQSQKSFLGSALRQNRLALFVGAGLSNSIGLPSWPLLTERVCLECGVDALDIRRALDSKDYYSIVRDARRRVPRLAEFKKIVRKHLYSDAPGSVFEYWRSPLFVALGSLIAGGPRGRVQEIVNLNFDDTFEQFLWFHGFPSQSITAPEKQLQGGASAHIFHPHGFLPASRGGLPQKESDFLLFTREEADDRIANSDAWKETLKTILRSKVCLFIGLSEDTAKDYVLTTLFNPVFQEIGSRKAIGFWFFKRPVRDKADEFLAGYRIYAIEVDDYDEIPLILLEICSMAALRLSRSPP